MVSSICVIIHSYSTYKVHCSNPIAALGVGRSQTNEDSSNVYSFLQVDTGVELLTFFTSFFQYDIDNLTILDTYFSPSLFFQSEKKGFYHLRILCR